MIGVVALTPDGSEQKMSIEEWQNYKDLGYTFLRTYTEPSTSTSTEKTYIKPSIISTPKQAKSSTKKGCGCGK